jgi:hypothetical protein
MRLPSCQTARPGLRGYSFELWKGRWFAGGSRTDPLPHLRAWDHTSGGPLQPEPVPVGQDSVSKRLFYDGAE